MMIDLKPEQQRVIDLAVGSGAYQNPSDWMLDGREAIAAYIEKGFLQAERGELIDGHAAIEMLRKRRAERLKRQA